MSSNPETEHSGTAPGQSYLYSGLEFAVTFGQRYRQDRHPSYARITPDGFVTIVAADEVNAKLIAEFWFGAQGYSMIYGADTLDVSFYPRGEIGRIVESTWLMRTVQVAKNRSAAVTPGKPPRRPRDHTDRTHHFPSGPSRSG